MITLDLRAAGRSAMLATFGSLDDVVRFRAAVRRDPIVGVSEVVSGARTLLFRFDADVIDATRLRAALGRTGRDTDPLGSSPGGSPEAPGSHGPDPITVPVVYDGQDLRTVAETLGMSRSELVAWHTGQVWTSAFCGFAPGFSYLTGSSPALDVPRRAAARTIVPSGSVALAGEFSAVYPRTSPGGWQLIGRTDLPMWSTDRDPPATAPAGTRLRFVDVGAA